MVYATDRSKAVSLLYVFSCFVYYEAFHVVSHFAPRSHVLVLFSPVHVARGKESWSICFPCICVFILLALRFAFSVEGWLWVTIATGLFYLTVFINLRGNHRKKQQ